MGGSKRAPWTRNACEEGFQVVETTGPDHDAACTASFVGADSAKGQPVGPGRRLVLNADAGGLQLVRVGLAFVAQRIVFGGEYQRGRDAREAVALIGAA